MSQPAPATPPPPPPQPNNTPDDRPHKPADDSEEVYYQGSPRLRGELGMLALWCLCGIVFIALPFLYKSFSRNHAFPIWWVTLGLIVVGLICFFIPYIKTRMLRYRISNYRIDCERGLLSRRIDTLELWHVEDITFQQSLFDRILGVGDIKVISHDDTTPQLLLRGLPNPRPLFESLKQRIIAVKRQRGVIKMDIGT
jgi:membrane protein YdbS with pleckstrin-like domain